MTKIKFIDYYNQQHQKQVMQSKFDLSSLWEGIDNSSDNEIDSQLLQENYYLNKKIETLESIIQYLKNCMASYTHIKHSCNSCTQQLLFIKTYDWVRSASLDEVLNALEMQEQDNSYLYNTQGTTYNVQGTNETQQISFPEVLVTHCSDGNIKPIGIVPDFNPMADGVSIESSSL